MPDTRRCDKCLRPARFFGIRDLDTGWIGRCQVCNWNFHYGDAVRVIDYRLLASLSLRVCRNVVTFLVTSKVHQKLKDSLLDAMSARWKTDIRLVQRSALQKFWFTTLLSCSEPKVFDAGTTRDANTDDENEDGVYDQWLSYENPLWKLQLALTHRHMDEATFASDDNCFQLMVSYLGRPSRSSAYHATFVSAGAGLANTSNAPAFFVDLALAALAACVEVIKEAVEGWPEVVFPDAYFNCI